MSNNNYKQDIKSFVRIKEIEYNPEIVEGNFDNCHLSQVHAYIFKILQSYLQVNLGMILKLV